VAAVYFVGRSGRAQTYCTARNPVSAKSPLSRVAAHPSIAQLFGNSSDGVERRAHRFYGLARLPDSAAPAIAIARAVYAVAKQTSAVKPKALMRAYFQALYVLAT